ncbi:MULTISPECIES: 4Fe-4S dicluster domain-containing protein [Desulfosediminicola]|uniref:4Fe-4S dicluster domain-containing protein n=1 Tax=Desulfosediminicola TaxID=2886823 RepID=UPI0026BC36B5
MHHQRGTEKSVKKKVMARQKLQEIIINRDWCKGCSICIALCPKNVLELDKKEKATVARPEDCIVCKLCELRCPDLAITVLTSQEGENGK